MTPAPDEVISRCYRHPDREALIRCTRCDRPICPDCMRPASVGFQCPDDVRQGTRSIRAARTSVGATIIQSPPYVTMSLVALNVALYLVTGLASGASLRDPTTGAANPNSLFAKWQLSPFEVHQYHRYYEFLTSAFLHVSLVHIVFNMVALAVTGPILERVLGRWRFAALYLLSALGGSAAIYAFGSQYGTTVGASGAIFGLFGAALILARRVGLDLQWLVAIVVINFIATFSIHNISKLGHIGGFVTGILVGLAIGGLPSLRRRVPTRVQGAGLGTLLAVIVLIIGIRTATW